jgi:hypothetical protein
MVLHKELEGNGVSVVLVNRPLGTTPEDQLLLQMQGVVAEHEAQALREQAQRHEALQVVFSHVQGFADQVKASLPKADWPTRREILRALVKRVEVGNDTINIVYKVPPRPFDVAPGGGHRNIVAHATPWAWHPGGKKHRP